jgi:Tol biopolymer transport system component/polyisoprenoid-binding protein YceI
MVAGWKRRRLSVRVALVGLLVFLALSGAGYAYFALRTSGAPDPAALHEAPRSAGGPSALNGEWVLVRQDPGFVGYRVREVLAVVPAPNDAVGRTSAVQAAMTIADGRIEAAQATADLRQLRSDEEGRDPAAQMALATESFPRGTFRLTRPIDLRSPRVGERLQVNARGALTLRGITRTVDFPLEVRWNGDSFQIAGQLEIRRTDFGLEFPQQLGLSVSDDAKVEVELTFVHRGSEATPTSSTTTQPEPDATHVRERPAKGRGRLLVVLVSPGGHGTSVYGVNVDGSGLTRVTRPANEPGYWTLDSHPVISPDGSDLLYSRQLDSPQSTQLPDVYIARSDGKRARELVDADGTGAFGTSPVFSRDGSAIAWADGTSDGAAIMVMNRKSKAARAITDATRPAADPTLSPDGTRVAFSAFTKDGNNDVFVVDADGSGRTRLTAGPEYDLTPAWSPDGRRIAFARDGDIYVMAPDGSDVARLTSGAARDAAPSWSPDGRRVAFVRSNETGRTRAGPSRIVVMRSDGSHERRVPLPREALWPSWMP